MSLYIAGVMGVFKPLLNYGMKETRVDGLPILLDILERGADRDRGLITISPNYLSGSLTVSNHISTQVLDLNLGRLTSIQRVN
ncbi:hypothetical protein MJO29_004909 [Puccinia striiformis f. sp. tritici]|nr:hypothetical protein MJO29_004909 [Puccinia striiformis f. sp. tritici]